VAVLVLGYVRDMRRDGSVSATTTIAALVTLCLGAVATRGYPVLALAASASVMLLLAAREPLHGWLRKLSGKEVQATARFAIIAAAILPLLPDRRFGPYDAWNPRQLWLVVVLVAGFSFAGYIANRRFGATRGTIATAAIGGMYSSTAVIAALSLRLRDEAESRALLTAGIALASAVMFVRVLVLTGVFALFALPSLALAIGPGAVVAVALAGWSLYRAGRSRKAGAAAPCPGNPFRLLPALGFALVVAAMALAARWAALRFGGAGVAVTLAITGTFDVDAAVVTMGGLPHGTLTPRLAGLVLAGPVLLNTLFKAGIVVVNGGRRGLVPALPLLAGALAIVATVALMLFAG